MDYCRLNKGISQMESVLQSIWLDHFQYFFSLGKCISIAPERIVIRARVCVCVYCRQIITLSSSIVLVLFSLQFHLMFCFNSFHFSLLINGKWLVAAKYAGLHSPPQDGYVIWESVDAANNNNSELILERSALWWGHYHRFICYCPPNAFLRTYNQTMAWIILSKRTILTILSTKKCDAVRMWW